MNKILKYWLSLNTDLILCIFIHYEILCLSLFVPLIDVNNWRLNIHLCNWCLCHEQWNGIVLWSSPSTKLVTSQISPPLDPFRNTFPKPSQLEPEYFSYNSFIFSKYSLWCKQVEAHWFQPLMLPLRKLTIGASGYSC